MEKNNEPFGKKAEKDKDILDLNDETSSSEDDIIDLSDTADPSAPESGEDILDLTEAVHEKDGDDEEVLDLLEAVEPSEDQDDVLDLTEPVDQDAFQEDDVIDLLHDVEPDSEEDDILDLSDLSDDSLEDTISSSERVEGLEPEQEDHILDLTEETAEEAPSVIVPGPSDDQEILDLIDDIQSTLDETDGTAEETALEGQDVVDASMPAGAPDEALEDASTLEGPGELIDEGELIEPETDLVDNLGLDLTSEQNRDILNGDDDTESSAGEAENIPFEAADSTLGERVEAIVERVLQEKLETIVNQRIEEAVQKKFDGLRKEILE